MSSIPSSAMKHATAHRDEPAAKTTGSGDNGARKGDGQLSAVSDYVTDLAGDVTDAIKARPKTAAAVGAAVVAGAAAFFAAPSIKKAVGEYTADGNHAGKAKSTRSKAKAKPKA